MALAAARLSAGVPAPPRRLPALAALPGLMPASLTFGARPRPACVAPARAALGFVFAFAAPAALGAAAVLAAFPREEAPDLLVLAPTGLGAAFRAAPRFAPAALPLVVAVPGVNVVCKEHEKRSLACFYGTTVLFAPETVLAPRRAAGLRGRLDRTTRCGDVPQRT